MVMPPVEGIEDKLMLLRAYKAELPMPTEDAGAMGSVHGGARGGVAGPGAFPFARVSDPGGAAVQSLWGRRIFTTRSCCR